MSIESLLQTATISADAFAKASGMHCKDGCGFCCTNPRMETTVAEMMPQAKHFWDTSQAEEVLTRIEVLPEVSICVNFDPDPLDQNKGKCKAYAYRPGICRLFGYCARTDKNGRRELMTCAVIKENFPEAVLRGQRIIDEGYPAPMMSDHSMLVYGADPNWGKELLPINQALAKAIERIGLKAAG